MASTTIAMAATPSKASSLFSVGVYPGKKRTLNFFASATLSPSPPVFVLKTAPVLRSTVESV